MLATLLTVISLVLFIGVVYFNTITHEMNSALAEKIFNKAWMLLIIALLLSIQDKLDNLQRVFG